MPIPNRTAAADYHFHTYDYAGSATPFTLSPPQAQRDKLRFYSVVQDLAGLLTGGIHAREWIAPEITYLVAEYLIKNYRANPVSAYETAIHDLVDSRRIYVAPVINPEGNLYSVFSVSGDGRDWRKNRRVLPSAAAAWVNALTIDGVDNPPFTGVGLNSGGEAEYQVPKYGRPGPGRTITLPTQQVIGVDLNRNFETDEFGQETDRNGEPSEDDYFGTAAASETETQNVQTLLDILDQLAPKGIDTSIDYHSYGQFILYPTEAADWPNPGYTALGLVLQRLIEPQLRWAYKYDYKLGTPGELLYDAVGSLADYAATKARSGAFVIELDPRGNDPGFALPEDKIMGVFEKNIRAALALIAAAGQLSGATAGGWFERHAITSQAEIEYLDWNVFGRGNRLPL